MYNGLHWGRREEGVTALVEWIDSEQQRTTNQRWGLWGGVVGGLGGLAGGAMGVIAGGMNIGPGNPVFYLPLFLWFTGSMAMTVWVAKKSREDAVTWGREARNQMTRLLVARWHGNLRAHLGEEGAQILNEAAGLLLQCRSVLNAPAWKAAAGGTVWSEMREKSLRAMDSAMARLLLLVTSVESNDEAAGILADMRSMNQEVSKAAKRHAMATGQPLGGSDGLRETLQEMKELSAADEEYLEQRY